MDKLTICNRCGSDACYVDEVNQDIKTQLIQTFGNTIFASDGTLQTKELSDLVFNSADSSNLARLNAIVHPPLLDTLFTKAEELAHDHDMVIIDIALLYETGLEQGFDYIIGVTSEDHLRFDRIEKRSGLTKEEISKRIQAQISQEELIQKADFIIENNGSKEELIDATECILAFLPYLPNTIHDDESE